MRLRITVRRHSLPDTPIVWNVDSPKTCTIKLLLDQINEAIPIEADTWGLEEYAVELQGSNGINFECLHFQTVGKILKEDDEVLIRPLLSEDVKVRKMSGRHQISSDGKKLYDGIAFGRPRLRRPADRPPVNIPPRKRARIEYLEDEVDEDENCAQDSFLALEEAPVGEEQAGQLVLHADFDDEDSEDDEDFEPGGEDASEAEDSSEDDDEDVDTEQEIHEDDSKAQEEGPDAEGDESVLRDVSDGATRAKIKNLHSAFPSAAIAVCKSVLNGASGAMGDAYEAMSLGFQPSKPKSTVLKNAEKFSPSSKVGSKKRKLVEGPEALTKPGSDVESEPEQDPLLDYYDRNGLPPGSITSGKALESMADAMKDSLKSSTTTKGSTVYTTSSKVSTRQNVSTGLASTPRVDEDSQDDDLSGVSSSSDEGSSEDSSSEDDEDDDADSNAASTSVTSEVSSSDSESDSSDDSSSDDEAPPDEVTSKPSLSVPDSTKKRSSSSQEQDTPQQSRVPPGQGKNSTQKRNERRRKANALDRFKKRGILPAGTAISEFIALDLPEDVSKEEAVAALEALRASGLSTSLADAGRQALAKADEFQTRRRELLAAIESGGVEADQSLAADEKVPKKGTKSTAFKETVEVYSAPASSQLSAKLVIQPQAVSKDEAVTSPSQRPRIDLGVFNRNIFGSLGVRTPKTKEDEEKLKARFMKDVRPLPQPKSVEDPPTESANADDDAEDPESWHEKINYRAVECCHDGIELSTPPFPFVQRWDPQQQNPWNDQAIRKRKNGVGDQSQQYDDQRAKKQKRQRKNKHSYAEEQEHLDASYEPSYQDDSMMQEEDPIQDSGLAYFQESVPRDDNDMSVGVDQAPSDLAPLPEDPSGLPNLLAGKAGTGMTIAFKKLDMSEATNWSPVVSAYQTAVVMDVVDDKLHLILALRDRYQAEKFYDEETGERIYGKFEMAVDENESQDDEQEQAGKVILSFNELIEPKVVQEAPADLGIEPGVGEASTSNKEDASEAQLSHVTETQLQSVTDGSDKSQEQSVKPSQEPNVPEQVSDLPAQEIGRATKAPSTPKMAASLGNKLEEIASADRHEISTLIKETGFRSSIPPEIVKGLDPDPPGSPGDALVFAKLLNENNASTPRSPAFHGFGSSPLRQPPRLSLSPAKSVSALYVPLDPPQSSWQTIDSQEPSSPIAMSDAEKDEDNAQIAAQSPTKEVRADENEDDDIWETLDVSDSEPEDKKRKPKVQKLRQSKKFGLAQELWQSLQPRQRDPSQSKDHEAGVAAIVKPRDQSQAQDQEAVSTREPQALSEASTKISTTSPNIDSKSSSRPVLSLDGAQEEGSTAISSRILKLSAGLSFTSQVSDHGHQPDNVFDETIISEVPKATVSEHDQSQVHDKMSDADSESGSEVDSEVEQANLQAQVEYDRVLDEIRSHSNASEDLEQSSSDESLPAIKEIVSNVQITRTRLGAGSRNTTTKEQVPTSDTTSRLKSPQTSRNAPLRASKSPNAKAQGSKPRSVVYKDSKVGASQPTTSQMKRFSVPPGSQVMDLTMTSDAEPEEKENDDCSSSPELFQRSAGDAGSANGDKSLGTGWVVKQRASSQAQSGKTSADTLSVRSSSQNEVGTKKSKRGVRNYE